MSWHFLVTSDQGTFELAGFMNALVTQHKREIENMAALHPMYPVGTRYTLFRRPIGESGAQMLFLPNDVMHLVSRLDEWADKIQLCEGEPNLAGCNPFPIS